MFTTQGVSNLNDCFLLLSLDIAIQNGQGYEPSKILAEFLLIHIEQW
jgi:hypothetical protein